MTKILRSAFVAVLSAALVSGCEKKGKIPPNSPRTIPIRWTSAVHLKNAEELNNLDRLLDRPLNTDNGLEEMILVGEGGEQVVVRNCLQYWWLKEKGYTFLTNHDNAVESWFKAEVYPLVLLGRARPSERSYVSDFNLKDEWRRLPASLEIQLEDPPAGENREQRPWREAYPDSKMKVSQEGGIVISDEYSDTHVEAIAWGDFDGDGVEDVLLSVANYVREGTFKTYRYIVITRKAVGGIFSVVLERD